MEVFGKRAKSILAAGALSAASLSAENLNNFENTESEYSPKYRHAMIEMYERVQTLDKEFGAVRVLYQNGTERFYWVKSINSAAITFDVGRIEKISAQNPKEIELLHSHPDALEKIIDEEDDENIRPQPPSPNDFLQAIATIKANPETDFKFKAMDHYGLWSYSPNIENPKIKMIYEHAMRLDDFLREFSKDYSGVIDEDMLQFLIRIDRPDFQKMPLTRDLIHEFSPALKNKWEALIESRRELDQNCPEMLEIETFELKASTEDFERNPQSHIKKYIDACKKLGIDIQFESIDNFKK